MVLILEMYCYDSALIVFLIISGLLVRLFKEKNQSSRIRLYFFIKEKKAFPIFQKHVSPEHKVRNNII